MIAELVRKFGRTSGQVKLVLRVLTNKRFIERDPDRHHALKIIRAWEYSFTLQHQVIKRWEHN
jgi:hypothetical protein